MSFIVPEMGGVSTWNISKHSTQFKLQNDYEITMKNYENIHSNILWLPNKKTYMKNSSIVAYPLLDPYLFLCVDSSKCWNELGLLCIEIFPLNKYFLILSLSTKLLYSYLKRQLSHSPKWKHNSSWAPRLSHNDMWLPHVPPTYQRNRYIL